MSRMFVSNLCPFFRRRRIARVGNPCARRPCHRCYGSAQRWPSPGADRIRHIAAPTPTIHASSSTFAGILIIIATFEKPSWAMTTPPAAVGKPPQHPAIPTTSKTVVANQRRAVDNRSDPQKQAENPGKAHLNLSHRERRSEQHFLLRPRGRGPPIDHHFERDAVHSLQCAGYRQARRREHHPNVPPDRVTAARY